MTASRILGLSPGWARRALIASLVVNFLVIGLAAGAAMRAQDKPRYGWGGFVSQQIVDLSQGPESVTVRNLMESRKEAMAKLRAERMESWRAIIAQLNARPFEPQSLNDELLDQVERRNAARFGSYAAMAEAMTLLTDAERAALAARIETYMKSRYKAGR
ncbi:MAG: hypothetical protein AAGF90_11005 [Pseudomonadota bacterium]